MLKRGFQFAPGYRLQEFLGRGHFGQVWRATAPGGASAAVKFIDLSDGQGEREYEAVGRVKAIRHANLMPITAIWLLNSEGAIIDEAPSEVDATIDFSVPEAQGASGLFDPKAQPHWLVVSMLLGGQSLQQRLRSCVDEGLPGIPPRELISYMDESAKGLDFLNSPLHDLGDGPVAIQHADVKPGNIVLIGSSAVVCDFGLARILSRNQVTATSASGTPAYMAPEAIKGKPSRTTDQYALAVTYYHLRTGTLPLNDGSIWEVLDAHRTGNLSFSDVAPNERAVLQKATAMEWEDRFDTCVDMVDSLRDALRSEGLTKPSFAQPVAPTVTPKVVSTANESIENAPEIQTFVDVQQSESAVEVNAGDDTAEMSWAERSTANGLDSATVESIDQIAAPVNTPTSDQPASDTKTPDAGTPDAVLPGGLADRWGGKSFYAGIAGGIAILVLVGSFLIGGGDEPAPSDNSARSDNSALGPVVAGTGDESVTEQDQSQANKDGTSQDRDSIKTLSATELIAQASALVDSDPSEAVSLYRQAVEIDGQMAMPKSAALSGHKGAVHRLVITPDGERLVSIADDAEAFVWNAVATEPMPVRLPVGESIPTLLELIDDGKRLVCGSMSNNSPTIWNLASRSTDSGVLTMRGHSLEVDAVAWAQESAILVSSARDAKLGVWKLAGSSSPNQPGAVIENKNVVYIDKTAKSLAVDQDERWLGAVVVDPVERTSSAVVMPWGAVANMLSTSSAPETISVAASGARKLVFADSESNSNPVMIVGSTGGAVSVYTIVDSSTASTRGDSQSQRAPGQTQQTKQGRAFSTNSYQPRKIDALPSNTHTGDIEWLETRMVDGKSAVFSGAADGTIHRWIRSGIASYNRLDVPNEGSPVLCMDVDQAGQWIAVGDDSGDLWLWDCASDDAKPSLAKRICPGAVESVRIDPTGKHIFAGLANGTIRRIDLPAFKLQALSDPVDMNASPDLKQRSNQQTLTRSNNID